VFCAFAGGAMDGSQTLSSRANSSGMSTSSSLFGRLGERRVSKRWRKAQASNAQWKKQRLRAARGQRVKPTTPCLRESAVRVMYRVVVIR